MSDGGVTLAPMLQSWGRPRPVTPTAPMAQPVPTVPPEFKGKARALIARVQRQAPEIVRGVEALYAPLRRRAERGQAMQERELAAALRQLRALPQYGVLDTGVEFDSGRRTLDIMEFRLTTAAFSKSGWVDPHQEPALSIDLLSVQARKGHAKLGCQALCLVSMHAISRWFQRSFKPTEAELFADLALIAGDAPDLLEATRAHPQHQWGRTTASGRWAGEACKYKGQMLLACDTFFDADNWTSGDKDRWLFTNHS